MTQTTQTITETGRQYRLDQAPVLASILWVHPNPYQPESRLKFAQETIIKMADSIQEHGLILLPVVRIRKDEDADNPTRRHYEIGDGWLRLCAYRYLSEERKLKGYNAIPVIIRELSDRQMADMVIEANTVRQDLNPIELGQLYRRYLEDFKITQDELAVRHKTSRSEITNHIRLLDLPGDIQQKVVVGEISYHHGRSLLRLNDQPKVQQQLIKEIKEEGLTTAKLEYEVSKAVWQKTKPLYDEPYGSVNPLFDLAGCKKCEHQMLLKSPWGNKEEGNVPRCDDSKCWYDKQKEVIAAQSKGALEELSKLGITRILLDKEMDWRQHAYLPDELPSECKACDKKGAMKVHGPSFNIICLDKKCHDKRKKEEHEQQKKTEQERVQKAEELVNNIFGSVISDQNETLFATIECLLQAANSYHYPDDTPATVTKLADYYGLYQKGDKKQPVTIESVLAQLRTRPPDTVRFYILPRLAFEMFRAVRNDDKQINAVLERFRNARQVTKNSRPKAQEIQSWECPFEKVRDYPDCFEDCPDVEQCKMKDSWKQTRPLLKLEEGDDPLADFDSQVGQDGQKHHITYKGSKYQGKNLVTVIQHALGGLSVKKCLELVRSYPDSDNKKMILGILEVKK